jgi:hypothetical protein
MRKRETTRRRRRRRKNEGKKDEWLHRRCASFNKMINNQSARCFIHHFDPTCFYTYKKKEDNQLAIVILSARNDRQSFIQRITYKNSTKKPGIFFINK